MIEPDEDESVVRGRRPEMRAHGMAGMKADALDRDRGAQSRLSLMPLSRSSDPLAVIGASFRSADERKFRYPSRYS